MRAPRSHCFSPHMNNRHLWQLKKLKFWGPFWSYIPAKQHCQFSPFGPTSVVNGLDWHCCLAGSSKTAPRILIFSIAMVADYSFYVKNIDIWAPAFFKHNNSFIATVVFAVQFIFARSIYSQKSQEAVQISKICPI